MNLLTKSYFFFLLICLTSINSSAQAVFQSVIGGSQKDEAFSIAHGDDGCFAIAGNTSSYGAGASNMFIAKFSEEGLLIWSKIIGGSDNESANSISSTTDGGFIAAGRTYPFGGRSNMFVVKLNADGMIEWEREITGIVAGEETSDFAHSVIQTKEGGYMITGEAYSFNSVPPWGTFVYVVKLTATGTLDWSRVYGGPHNGISVTRSSVGRSVIQTTDGGFAIAGFTAAFGTTVNNSMYLIKIDANGLHQWSRTIGGGADDRAYSVIQTLDGGYALAGETGSYGQGGGYKNMYVVKFDNTGSIEWTKSIGGPFARDDVAYSIVQTSNGDFIAAGYTLSFGNNVYLVKLSSTGNLIWSKSIGGSSNDFATSIIETRDGGIALSGFSYSFGNSPSWPSMLIMKLDNNGESCGNTMSPASTTLTGGILTSPETSDYTIGTNLFSPGSTVQDGGMLYEVCFLTGIEPTVNSLPDKFNLSQNYPNPFNPVTKINFSIPKISEVKVKVFDALGREVSVLVNQTLQPGFYDFEFNGANFSSGVYFYRIEAGDFVETRRMMLIK